MQKAIKKVKIFQTACEYLYKEENVFPIRNKNILKFPCYPR